VIGNEGLELWKSNGTIEGTSPVTGIHLDGGSHPEMIGVGERLFFNGNNRFIRTLVVQFLNVFYIISADTKNSHRLFL
jgi:ELWxxDGT repeat protein